VLIYLDAAYAEEDARIFCFLGVRDRRLGDNRRRALSRRFTARPHIGFADSSVYRLLKKITEVRRAKTNDGGVRWLYVDARRLMVRRAHHERNDLHRPYSL